MTEPGKSIRAHLLNLAKKENIAFQLVIIRYFHERLLYRISISRYANNFFLKGGTFLYYYTREQTRPTMDIDFLGYKMVNDINSVRTILREICLLEYSNDAVTFDGNAVSAEEITGQDEYSGVRLFVTAKLDTIQQRIQIDIGFGDLVIPSPVRLNYPVLLPGSEMPVIQAYSLETVIAEKFEAMIDLSTLNSRMKDFYDVYIILTTQHIDLKLLEKAIHVTFHNRSTSFTPDHALFSPSFATDPGRVRQWKAFLIKSHLDLTLDFIDVLGVICDRLLPIWNRLPFS